LKQEYLENEQLSGRYEMLKDELEAKEVTLRRYRVMTKRSVGQLGEVLRRLVGASSGKDREFELLKMAQCLSEWEKVLQDEEGDAHLLSLSANPAALSTDRTHKLE
jgi:hypothetical protein